MFFLQYASLIVLFNSIFNLETDFLICSIEINKILLSIEDERKKGLDADLFLMLLCTSTNSLS